MGKLVKFSNFLCFLPHFLKITLSEKNASTRRVTQLKAGGSQTYQNCDLTKMHHQMRVNNRTPLGCCLVETCKKVRLCIVGAAFLGCVVDVCIGWKAMCVTHANVSPQWPERPGIPFGALRFEKASNSANKSRDTCWSRTSSFAWLSDCGKDSNEILAAFSGDALINLRLFV